MEPPMTSETFPTFELLDVETRDSLGEGPWWSAEDQYLYWVDIVGRRVRGARLDGSEELEISTPSEVGFVIPGANDSLLLGLRDGLHRREAATGRIDLLVDPGHDPARQRINDGKTDRSGNLWFGTMHDGESEPISALYMLSNGKLRTRESGIITSNGLGWSPDDTAMYYTDSLTRRITKYDFEPTCGEISNPRPFADDASSCVPDGLTVDADGFVWGAKWDGGCVVRYSPDGEVVQTLRLPVSRPTSCMFVGHDLRTLAITSAQPARRLDEPLAGSVFLLDVGVAGLAEIAAHI